MIAAWNLHGPFFFEKKLEQHGTGLWRKQVKLISIRGNFKVFWETKNWKLKEES
jgi:hypothetical protein